jgi:Glycosyl hydrolases family 43
MLVSLGALAFAVQTDVGAHSRARQENSELTATSQRLATSKESLRGATFVKAVTTNQRDALQSSDMTTRGQLSATRQKLSGTDTFAFLQGVDIGTLQTCLGGVQNSYQQIGAHNNSQAADDLSTVSAACSALGGGGNTGLVYPFDFPDPDVLQVGGTYFAYATNSVGGNIQIIESTDLTTWKAAGNALPQLPPWASPDGTWAPSVIHLGNTFLLYYAAIARGIQEGVECISVAISSQPQGPFVDSSTAPLECQPTLGGSIDPSAMLDSGGGLFLQWKSVGGSAPATIWSQQLAPSGTSMAPNTSPVPLLSPDERWQSATVEAPDLVETDGHFLLFYSGNNWGTSAYGVGYANCSGPLGPCTDASTQPILASTSDVSGPGGECAFTDASGSTWIAFAAWTPGQVGYPYSRKLYVRQLDLSGAVPSIGNPP